MEKKRSYIKKGRDYNEFRKSDGMRKAKPIGYRFVGEIYRKPTAAEIAELHEGKRDDIYYEARPERSDKKPSAKKGDKFEKGGSVGIAKGDLVFCKEEGHRGLVGLVTSDKKEEDGVTGFDVYFRGYNGAEGFIPQSEMVDIYPNHYEHAENNGDLSHYPTIAKKIGIELNPKYAEALEDFPEDDNYKKGGDLKSALEDFDINSLDAFEARQYEDFLKHSSKEEALQILINSTEGDYSQLSPKLAKIAKKYESDNYKKGGKLGNATKSEREDVEATKELVIKFLDRFGDKFNLLEHSDEIVNKIKASTFKYSSARVFIGFDVRSNIPDKLAVGQTKPSNGYIVLSSDVNPNGMGDGETPNIARAWVIDLEIKGKKRYSQRTYEEGRYAKSYNYARTIDGAIEKFEDYYTESFQHKIKNDDLKFDDVNLFEKGGSLGKKYEPVHSNYLTITPSKNGLKIELTPEGKEEADEIGLDENNFWDLFEQIQSNSEYMYFPDAGEVGLGMTSAPAITDGYYYDDKTSALTDKGIKDSRLFSFMDYQVKSFVEELLEKGEVFFPSAGEDKMKDGGFFDRAKAMAHKGYHSSKEHVNKKVHDFKKKTALEVIDATKDKVSAHKYKMALAGAEEIVEDKYKEGGEVDDEKLYYVVGKKKGQLVDITELPMIKEDAERWIKEQSVEKHYDFNTVDIIPYHGSKPRFKYGKGGGLDKFKKGDSVSIAYISDNSKHNGKVGVITWLNDYNYYPKGDESVVVKKTQAEITYDDGSVEEISDIYQEGSGLVSPVVKVSKMATGGVAGNDAIYYGVVDANNKLVFESTDESTAKQVSWNYEGSIMKKYKGSSLGKPNKDYKYFVYNNYAKKIVSGWENRSDADADRKKRADAFAPYSTPLFKVYSASYVKSTLKLDPFDNGSWYKEGGDVGYKETMGLVKVKFENPKYNYSTNVSGAISEADARKYFVGKYFDVESFPKEKLERVIDIEFFPKGTYEEGGEIKEGKNGYVAFYRGKQMDVYADSSYQAQQKAAAAFKAKKSYEVTVMLAEIDGKQVTHVASFKKGGEIPNNYEGKNSEQVWDAWTQEQRKQFITDHFDENDPRYDVPYYNSLIKLIALKYDELPDNSVGFFLQQELYNHIAHGQYKKGGTLEKGSPEWHQVQIAKKTVKMNPSMISMMGGMTLSEAEGILKKHGMKYEMEDGGDVDSVKHLIFFNVEGEPKFSSLKEARTRVTELRKKNPDIKFEAKKTGLDEWSVMYGTDADDFFDSSKEFETPEIKHKEGGEVTKKYDVLYYAVHDGAGKSWDEHEQKQFKNVTWKQAVAKAKTIAKDRKSEVRLSTSKGYNNQGHYFHHQSLKEGGEIISGNKIKKWFETHSRITANEFELLTGQKLTRDEQEIGGVKLERCFLSSTDWEIK